MHVGSDTFVAQDRVVGSDLEQRVSEESKPKLGMTKTFCPLKYNIQCKEFFCTLCVNTSENLRIHLKNVHIRFGHINVSREEDEESTGQSKLLLKEEVMLKDAKIAMPLILHS